MAAPGTKAKVVLQQCTSAKLQVKPSSEGKDARFIEIGRGLVVYVCFLKGATKDMVEKMVKCILTTKLSETDEGKRVSILELPGDVLVIPQATLGGSLKGRAMQYHNNIDKTEGESLYQHLIEKCTEDMDMSCKCSESGKRVHCGTYGNRSNSSFPDRIHDVDTGFRLLDSS